MEDAELVEKLISGLQDSSLKAHKQSADLIEGMSETRMISLKEAIEEIQQQIKLRGEVHSQIVENVENLKSAINNMMPQNPHPTFEFQKAMIELKKKIVEAEEIRINERLNFFRDVALLKKELREIVREYRDKEKRADFLGDLLNEN